MRVVADSHALVWYCHDSPQLSQPARSALHDAITGDGVVISIVSLVELWYVTQTTHGVNAEELAVLRHQIDASPAMHLLPIDVPVADAFTAISRDVMRDPWDRFIVATAQVLNLALVTRDGLIRESGLVQTLW